MGRKLKIMQHATVLLLSLAFVRAANGPERPHIIIIVADDLGFNDVGFHGSTQIPTPNIDALAYSGLILDNYYVQPICTPSRSALMTGKHPIHTGLQHANIAGPHPYGLDLSETILPQRLANLGYTTQHVGKWHLGFFHKEYTPTFRGFESHFGYWTGRIDYYDHTAFENPGYWGYDMRRNMSVADDCYGKYSTDLFTDEAVDIIEHHNTSKPLFLYLAHLAVHSGNPYAPLQAPEDVVKKFSYIQDEHRRKFAGMLWKLDESVGKVVEALNARQMLHNSVILFTTDNGGPAAGFNSNAASNWPLRGVKAAMWEGGVRGAGILWSPKIASPGRVSRQMLHITDWLPTLISAAGGNTSNIKSLDGMDMWDVLIQGSASPRKEFLVNYDPILNGAAVRFGDWKLIYNPQGFGNHWDGWFGPSGRNETAPETSLKIILQMVINSTVAKAVKAINPEAYSNIAALRNESQIHCKPVPANATASCNKPSSPCLFNIASDPCEYTDLSSSHSDVMVFLKARLQDYIATAVPPRNKPFDPASNPKYWGYTWTNWKDYPAPLGTEVGSTTESPLVYDLYGDMRPS